MSVANNGYDLGLSVTGVASGAPLLGLTNAAIANIGSNTQNGSFYPIAVTLIQITTEAATACSLGLIVAATVGTATTSTFGMANDGARDGNPNASNCPVVTAWSAAPTINATPIYLRQITLPATAGSSVTWTWTESNPLILDNRAAGALLLWNFGGGACPNVSVNLQWYEQNRLGPVRTMFSNAADHTSKF